MQPETGDLCLGVLLNAAKDSGLVKASGPDVLAGCGPLQAGHQLAAPR